MRAELTESVGSSAENLILDLSDTRYLDSAGIDMLLRLSERLRQRRAKLRLVIPPSSQVLRLAELVALPDAIPVHSTVEEALDAVRRSAPEAPTGGAHGLIQGARAREDSRWAAAATHNTIAADTASAAAIEPPEQAARPRAPRQHRCDRDRAAPEFRSRPADEACF